jgi:hypothetical protein
VPVAISATSSGVQGLSTGQALLSDKLLEWLLFFWIDVGRSEVNQSELHSHCTGIVACTYALPHFTETECSSLTLNYEVFELVLLESDCRTCNSNKHWSSPVKVEAKLKGSERATF